MSPSQGEDFRYWAFINDSHADAKWGDCSVRWLEFAEKQQLPKEQRVQVRRALGHLVVDLGDEALKRAQRDYTFFASEDLYGLAGIKPPGR